MKMDVGTSKLDKFDLPLVDLEVYEAQYNDALDKMKKENEKEKKENRNENENYKKNKNGKVLTKKTKKYKRPRLTGSNSIKLNKL